MSSSNELERGSPNTKLVEPPQVNPTDRKVDQGNDQQTDSPFLTEARFVSRKPFINLPQMDQVHEVEVIIGYRLYHCDMRQMPLPACTSNSFYIFY